jgi:hypothetical protein
MIGMTQTPMLPPAAAAGVAYGAAVAAAITTFFGFFWLGWGLAYASAFNLTVWIVYYVMSIALGVVAIRAIIHSRARVAAFGDSGRAFWLGVQGRFFAALAAEFVGGLVVVGLCLAFHRMDLLAAGIGIVVGLHFLPLGALFRVPAYYLTGAVMVAASAASMMLFRGDAVTFFAGLVNGATLWLTAMVSLRRSREYARSANTT